ncbi:MAG: Holliday junction branch migration DNA helicase RuvB [Candidatus Aureabacteria bacterium]|nr:Holliday junction branch migration DNA helicase RuvB [Candidatus Auribacterota bacterium]
MNEKIFDEVIHKPDEQFENKLRPLKMDDFVGQKEVKERLMVAIEAASKRGESVDHILFSGPPGLGKTTLAYIIADAMGVEIRTSSGPVIEKPGDLAGILSNIEEGSIFFIDEIHRLNHVVEEYLYSAMEDFRIDVLIDQGPGARSIRLNLPRFTLIGATTRAGLLSAPLRARFEIAERLDYYNFEDIEKIVNRSSKILSVDIDKKGSKEIAVRSRGTPRIANALLKRVRDYAQVRADGKITAEIAVTALHLLGIDDKGLDDMDKKILETIACKFSGGPVGVNSIAVAVGEEAETIEEVYEPYLIQQGLLKRTPSGRKATASAYKHLGLEHKNKQQDELF